MGWFRKMFSATSDIHAIYLELEKARDEQKLVRDQSLRSSAQNRLTLAQAGVHGIEDFFKGLKK